MPKEVKVKPSLKKKERLDPLHVQILREEHHGKNVEIVGNRPSRKTRKNSKHHCDNSHSDDNDDVMENEEVADDISPAMTRKILLQAQEQQRELELEMNMTDSVVVKDEKVQFDSDSDDDDEDQEDQEEEDFDQQDFPLEHAEDVDANDYETFNPDENFDDNNEVELALFDKFRAGQTNIHSSLVEKLEFLRSSGGGNNGNDSNSKSLQALCASMPAKVVEAYGKVGLLLSRYKSGKLPKAFKIIPSLRNWEDVLALTQPEKWTAHAVYEATKIFVSNLNARMAQRFFHLVLLDRVRSEIAETRRLSYHLFAALKKSLYKPAAFFKGILLPLCEAGDCTLREATILAGVLVRVSIPVLHSSAALLKLAEMPYSGGNSIFIRALLDKKYALPYRVVDALVFHFLSFEHNPLADRYPLPVLWHQALLTLVQRYKHDLTLEQKECLCRLTLRRSHHQISGEIQRELMQSSVRQASSGSDKMDLVEGENPSTKTSQDHLKAFLEQEKQKMML